jgi:hypothetical protein
MSVFITHMDLQGGLEERGGIRRARGDSDKKFFEIFFADLGSYLEQD